MTSLKKIEANRLNGKKSKGPVTFNGKRWSSKNAIKHGLNATQSTLTIGENTKEHSEFVKQLTLHYRPFDYYSQILVDRIIDIHWKLKRISKIESGIYAFEIQAHEADQYKTPVKDEVNHEDFACDDKKRVSYQNLLYGIAYLKDSNSGNAFIKLSSHESKLINKLTQLEKIYQQHKEKNNV